MADLNSITEAEIITLLQMLFTNMNNLDKIYYDLFINTTAMDIDLERYDENGVLQTYTIPNRAKDRGTILSGQGSPEGSQVANLGSYYIDVLTSNLYYKSSGSDAYGWVLIYTALNFRDGYEYVSPTGNGSGIKNLNGSNVTGGVVGIGVGGTNNTSYTAGSIIKYDREDSSSPYKFMEAVADTDYMSPTSVAGQVGFFLQSTAPTGWLPANGSTVNQTTYARLYAIIGNTFNTGGEAAGTFRLPDLRGYFLRAWDNGRGIDASRAINTVQQSGAPNITGNFYVTGMGNNLSADGAFSQTGWRAGDGDGDGNINGGGFNFDASKSSSVYQSITEVRPINFSLLACIKY